MDQDILGQAFEDALEVLQQHSDGEIQYPPGKKDYYCNHLKLLQGEERFKQLFLDNSFLFSKYT